MGDKTWKQAERRVAALFGTRRRELSGGGRDQSDDCEHTDLYIEVKYGKQCAPAQNIYRKALAQSKKCGRVPVVALQVPSAKEILFIISSKDLDKLVAARIAVLHPPKKVRPKAKPRPR